MDDLIQSWKAEEQAPFEGWDFSYLDGRMIEEEPPWDYIDRAKSLMSGVDSVLDMATGGGERLLDMQSHWPARVVASEGYEPNVKLARGRLEPLGVQVVALEIDKREPTPFADAEFGLVLNRHSAFNVDDLARILISGGVFLTQQVHGLYAHELLTAFDVKPLWPEETPEHYVPWLQSAGFENINCQDWSGDLRFTDVGALVYYLRAVPWMVEGFSVDTHLDYLLKLQNQLAQEGVLVFEAKKYIIEAKKPG